MFSGEGAFRGSLTITPLLKNKYIYSLKNNPHPKSKVYLKMLINSSEQSFVWSDGEYFMPPTLKSQKCNKFGFTSTKPVPSHPGLKNSKMDCRTQSKM